jgi:hypothetical protein
MPANSGRDAGELGLRLGSAQCHGVVHRKPVPFGQFMYRRGLQPMTASRWARRLGVGGADAMSDIDQPAEDRRCEFRRAHEDEVERLGHVAL